MEWIKLINAKPDYSKRVLVHPIKSLDVIISRLEYDDEYGLAWVDDDGGTFDYDTVDFWMLLPEIPK